MGNSLYPEFLRGSDLDEVERAITRIADALTKCDADFLFGAGMSHSAGVPTGNKLSQRLLPHYFPPGGNDPPPLERMAALTSEYPFEAIMQAVQHAVETRENFRDALKEIFWNNSYTTMQEHHDLAAISTWEGTVRLRRIFTTNFDLLLEKTFGDRGVRVTEANAKDMRKHHEAGKIPIVYLHGQLDGEYYVTEEDVFKPDYRILKAEFLIALLQSAAFTFVGYSMTDPDFRRLYMEYRSIIVDRNARGKKTYVVSPPKDGYSYRLGSVVWRKRGATWIPLTAANFFQLLKHYLGEHLQRGQRSQIMRKYGLEDDDMAAFEDLVKRTQDALVVGKAEAIHFLAEAHTVRGGKL